MSEVKDIQVTDLEQPFTIDEQVAKQDAKENIDRYFWQDIVVFPPSITDPDFLKSNFFYVRDAQFMFNGAVVTGDIYLTREFIRVKDNVEIDSPITVNMQKVIGTILQSLERAMLTASTDSSTNEAMHRFNQLVQSDKKGIFLVAHGIRTEDGSNKIFAEIPKDDPNKSRFPKIEAEVIYQKMDQLDGDYTFSTACNPHSKAINTDGIEKPLFAAATTNKINNVEMRVYN